MKKNLLLIVSLFLINIYPHSSLAADFDLNGGEEDGVLTDLLENESNEFGPIDAETESANGSMYMQGTKLDGDLFQLSILSKDLTNPTLGIAFHLLYEKDRLAFLRYEPGDFLEKGGDPFYLVKNDISGDKIVFGETLRRNDNFPMGSGLIATIYFQILDEDQFNFEFKNGIISTLDTVRQDIDKIAWENFSFDKNIETTDVSDFGEISTLNAGTFSISNFWIVIGMVTLAIPFAYLIISYIKNSSKLKKYPQIN